MALPKFDSKSFAAVAMAGALAVSPMAAHADDAAQARVVPVAAVTQQINLVEDAGIAAGRFSETNPGIAVAIRLGTHPTTPTPERISEVLTEDFQEAGVTDPITFFFEQNDVPGSAAAFYYDGYIDGPFSLGQSRNEAAETAGTYNWRKNNGFLATASLEQ